MPITVKATAPFAQHSGSLFPDGRGEIVKSPEQAVFGKQCTVGPPAKTVDSKGGNVSIVTPTLKIPTPEALVYQQ